MKGEEREEGDPHRRIPAHVFGPRQRPRVTGRAVRGRGALGEIRQRRCDVVLALLLRLLDPLQRDNRLRRLLALTVVTAFLLRVEGWGGHGGVVVLLRVGRYGVGLLGVGVVLGIGVVLGVGLGWGGRGVGVAGAVRERGSASCGRKGSARGRGCGSANS